MSFGGWKAMLQLGWQSCPMGLREIGPIPNHSKLLVCLDHWSTLPGIHSKRMRSWLGRSSAALTRRSCSECRYLISLEASACIFNQKMGYNETATLRVPQTKRETSCSQETWKTKIGKLCFPTWPLSWCRAHRSLPLGAGHPCMLAIHFPAGESTALICKNLTRMLWLWLTVRLLSH